MEVPLGQRIVEMPDDVDQIELRDSRATFTTYVPVGSVTKGEALARTGGLGTTKAGHGLRAGRLEPHRSKRA